MVFDVVVAGRAKAGDNVQEESATEYVTLSMNME
jgi:hypothetical protein